MQKDLNELKLACQKEKGSTDNAKLEMGETLSLFGTPAPAEKGTIALKNGDNTLIVKESDVVETTKLEDGYLVNLKKGSEVIFRMEVVTQVNSDNCSCNDKKEYDETKEGTMELKTPRGVKDVFGGWDRFGGWWNPPYHCWYVVHWVKVCNSYKDKYGQLQVYCYVYPVAEKQCDSWYFP